MSYNQDHHILSHGYGTWAGGVSQMFVYVGGEPKYEPTLILTPFGEYANENLFTVSAATWVGGSNGWRFTIGSSISHQAGFDIKFQWQAVHVDPIRSPAWSI